MGHSIFKLSIDLQAELNLTQTMVSTMRHLLERSARLQCYDTAGMPQEAYDSAMAYFKLLLGPQRKFQRFHILRRGRGFAVDFGVAPFHRAVGKYSPLVLSLHGLKTFHDLTSLYGQRCLAMAKQCRAVPVRCSGAAHDAEGISDDGIMRAVREHPSRKPGLGWMNDVHDCWPYCSENISAPTWRRQCPELLRASFDDCPIEEGYHGVANRSMFTCP